ncbi:MAG: hypothetical protein JWN74_3306 [Acidobacteriaceae bacterium]|nr:hypothetical protein [Acidobacteriaceae bacterium]
MIPLRFFILIATLAFAAAAHAQTHKPASSPKTTTDEKCGPLAGQVLRCPQFGFTYKVIFGWVDRTADMQQDESLPDQSANAESGNTTSGTSDQPKPASSASSETLLAVFERPPAAPGDAINSAVVIAAEPLANYHGIKIAADYLNPISELAEQRGFKVVNQPYASSLGTKQLARADFSKQHGKLTMWQSSLVMIEKGYIVSFTFVGGSQDEVDDLLANLNFVAGKQAPHSAKAARE